MTVLSGLRGAFFAKHHRRSESEEFIRWSGAFAVEPYAKATGVSARKAIDHYLREGERQGLLPNPFFDPAYFEARSGTRSFLAYLSDQELFHIDPSPCFDSRGYIERYSASLSTPENPLMHFWRSGFDSGLVPSERFDMPFFLRATSRDSIDKRQALYDLMVTYDETLPQNLQELTAVQAAFKTARPLSVLRSSATDRQRNLVFVQAGRSWTPPEGLDELGVDLLVNLYEDAPAPPQATHVTRQDGTKTTAISELLARFPHLLLDYEAVLFLDDDVEIDIDGMARLFAIRRDHGLDLLQASLSEDSSCYFPALRQPTAGRNLRSISAVEIMMPLVSRRALEQCGWTFSCSVSGWMIDVLLSQEVGKSFGNTIAIAGDVVARHTRPTDPTAGGFYRYLRSNGILATQEAGALAMRYGITDKMSAVGYHVPDAFSRCSGDVDSGRLPASQ